MNESLDASKRDSASKYQVVPKRTSTIYDQALIEAGKMNPGVYSSDVPSPGLKPYTPSRRGNKSPKRSLSPKSKAKMY